MKVLHVYRYCEEDSKGGIEKHLDNLCRALCPDVQSTLLVSSLGTQKEYRKTSWGEIIKLPRLTEWGSLAINPALPSFLKNTNSDIVHVHWAHPLAVLAYFAAKPAGKLVVSYHMDVMRFTAADKLFSPFLHQFLKRADAIVTGSPAMLETSKALMPFREKSKVIPYGINVQEYTPDQASSEIIANLKTLYPCPLILYVGRLVWYKGLEVLLCAMKQINAMLLVVGDGPLRESLKKRAALEGVEKKVSFLGKVRSVVPYCHACDLLVLPSVSRAESFGLVQLEAMACSKPVVSTELGTGTSWVNRHGETGFVVQANDPSALAGAINRLLGDPSLREAMGKNGKAIVQENFTIDQTARKFLDLYQETIGSH